MKPRDLLVSGATLLLVSGGLVVAGAMLLGVAIRLFRWACGC